MDMSPRSKRKIGEKNQIYQKDKGFDGYIDDDDQQDQDPFYYCGNTDSNSMFF